MRRDTFIAKLTEIRQNVEQLLTQLQASEHDRFAAHLYRSRPKYRSACQRTRLAGWVRSMEGLEVMGVFVASQHGPKGQLAAAARHVPLVRTAELHVRSEATSPAARPSACPAP